MLRTLLLCTVTASALLADAPAIVRLARVPEAGIQPQAAVDAKGILHLIYYTGDAGGGDLRYVRSSDGGATFSKPLPVNSHPGAAIAAGNIRGAHIAVGRNGRVHVAWMGSDKAEPKGPKKATPMLYTRLNDAGTAFEPERNVIHSAYGLDGGGTLAAGDNGDVYVFWHAPEPGTEGEEHRRVWVAVSHDDGRTFSPEHAAGNVPTGACGCCGMSALVDHGGNVYAVYRSASQTVHRDIYILESRDRGQTFTASDVDPWKVGICVMSTSSLVPAAHGAFAAWETKGQIHFGDVDPSRGAVSKILSAPGESGRRKHPAIAVDKSGETLLAWTEGMGWKKGGSLSWQLYDVSGRPVGQPGHAEGVPTWSLLAAVPRPGGGFTILY